MMRIIPYSPDDREDDSLLVHIPRLMITVPMYIFHAALDGFGCILDGLGFGYRAPELSGFRFMLNI